MTDCQTTALLAAQILFAVGVLAIFVKLLIRTRGNAPRSLAIMTGFSAEPRDKVENVLGLVTLVGSIALFVLLNESCPAV